MWRERERGKEGTTDPLTRAEYQIGLKYTLWFGTLLTSFASARRDQALSQSLLLLKLSISEKHVSLALCARSSGEREKLVWMHKIIYIVWTYLYIKKISNHSISSKQPSQARSE